MTTGSRKRAWARRVKNVQPRRPKANRNLLPRRRLRCSWRHSKTNWAANLGAADAVRIDKLLWFLRLSKSRSQAQGLIAEGHVRLNGKRVEKSSIEARIGDVLTLPRGEGAIALRIDSMPSRRGPPLDARACYSEI